MPSNFVLLGVWVTWGYKMAADQRKMAYAIFFLQNAVTPEIIVGIAPYLEHRRTLGAPSILHTLTLV